MAGKVYAVKVGKVPGIYKSWAECKKMVDGYPGATYKSFATIEEAEMFIGEPRTKKIIKEESQVIAYVDGSYAKEIGRYSYGCVIKYENQIYELSGSDDKSAYLEMNNVAGELLGSIIAIKWAIEKGAKSICIYHDYEGIAKWANNEWKANKEGTQEYKKFIAECRDKIDITFEKVAAHTGVELNEKADELAKQALYSKKGSKDVSFEEELFRKMMLLKREENVLVIGNYFIDDEKIKKYICKVYEHQNSCEHNVIKRVIYEMNLNKRMLIYTIEFDDGSTYDSEISLEFI